MIDLRAIRTADEFQRLKDAAAADNHRIVLATHLIQKDGEIVGYGSVNGAPLVNVWLDSRKVEALESVRLLRRLTDGLSFTGARNVLMPCGENSPFYPVMEKLGFERLGSTTLHLKGL